VSAAPEQAPLQLTKAYPAAGVAVSITIVPGATLAEQTLPQLIPPKSPRGACLGSNLKEHNAYRARGRLVGPEPRSVAVPSNSLFWLSLSRVA